jgi:hypothetical protein
LLKDFSGVDVVCPVWATTKSLAKRSIASEIPQQIDKRSIVQPPSVVLSGTAGSTVAAGQIFVTKFTRLWLGVAGMATHQG